MTDTIRHELQKDMKMKTLEFDFNRIFSSKNYCMHDALQRTSNGIRRTGSIMYYPRVSEWLKDLSLSFSFFEVHNLKKVDPAVLKIHHGKSGQRSFCWWPKINLRERG